jgi:hypothetical protein
MYLIELLAIDKWSCDLFWCTVYLVSDYADNADHTFNTILGTKIINDAVLTLI